MAKKKVTTKTGTAKGGGFTSVLPAVATGQISGATKNNVKSSAVSAAQPVTQPTTYNTKYTPTYQAVAPTPIEAYQKSQEVADAEKRYTDFINGVGRPEYSSKYADTISELANRIANREKFQYNFNEDPLYQQYRDHYQRQAILGQQGAMASAAALTGGYGNSYAATAGNLAYQENMAQLNDVIPQLYDAAMRKYENDIAGQRADLSMYRDLEDTDYGRFRDTLSDWITDRDFYGQDYRDKYSLDYGQYRDRVGDTQWRDSFNQSENQYRHNYNSGEYWDDKKFDYQKERDKVSDKQWKTDQKLRQQAEDFDEYYKRMSLNIKDSASSSSGRSGGGYSSSGYSSSSGGTGLPKGLLSTSVIRKWKEGMNSGQDKVAWSTLMKKAGKDGLIDIVINGKNGNGKQQSRHYKLTPDQAAWLYYEYLGGGKDSGNQRVTSTGTDGGRNIKTYSDSEGKFVKDQKYQSLDNLVSEINKRFGYKKNDGNAEKLLKDHHVLGYNDFIRNMPSDSSLRQYKSYPDYLKKMAKKIFK